MKGCIQDASEALTKDKAGLFCIGTFTASCIELPSFGGVDAFCCSKIHDDIVADSNECRKFTPLGRTFPQHPRLERLSFKKGNIVVIRPRRGMADAGMVQDMKRGRSL